MICLLVEEYMTKLTEVKLVYVTSKIKSPTDEMEIAQYNLDQI